MTEKEVLEKGFIEEKISEVLFIYSEASPKMEYRDIALIENVLMKVCISLGLDFVEIYKIFLENKGGF